MYIVYDTAGETGQEARKERRHQVPNALVLTTKTCRPNFYEGICSTASTDMDDQLVQTELLA